MTLKERCELENPSVGPILSSSSKGVVTRLVFGFYFLFFLHMLFEIFLVLYILVCIIYMGL